VGLLATLAGCGGAAAGGGHGGSGGGAASSAGAAGTAGANPEGGAGASPPEADGASDAPAGVDGAVLEAGADLPAAGADGPARETAGDTSEAGMDLDVTKVVATPGCGQGPGQALGSAVRYTIATSGQKASSRCADGKCGPWSYAREYFVTLPASYDGTKPLPLVFVGPGCGGVGTQLGAFAPSPGDVIRVGLTPPPNDIEHATNPGQGCFDDKEGDDSVDFVFYESLYDVLKAQLCFDKNRVFAAGTSTGGWLAIELGCKYGGDAERPIRAIVANNGGLPTTAAFAPTCSGKPHAGLFIFNADDSSNGSTAAIGGRAAINQAMLVDGCAQTNLALATLDDFPIGGGNAPSTCKRVAGCSPLDPIVLCQIQTTVQSANAAVVGPGFTTFLGLFEEAPLRSP
jgi:hypothetical protein